MVDDAEGVRDDCEVLQELLVDTGASGRFDEKPTNVEYARGTDCPACAGYVLTFADGARFGVIACGGDWGQCEACRTCPWDGMPSQLVCGWDEADEFVGSFRRPPLWDRVG